MAIEILHSRTATLIDGSNPDEIQAADWNDAHPITGDGMGLLFSNSAGAVAETMTVDMGTLTATTPLTFKQTWDNAAQDVVFDGATVLIKPYDALDNPQGNADSAFFNVKVQYGDDSSAYVARFMENGQRFYGNLDMFGDRANLETGSSRLAWLQTSPSVEIGTSGSTNYARQTENGFFATVVTDPGSPLLETRASYGADGLNCENLSDGSATGDAPFYGPQFLGKRLPTAGVPTSTDVPDGYWAVCEDTINGDYYLATNNGGTIFKVQLT
jgi:hypothetical protein